MAWADVKAKIKFWGLGDDLDGQPLLVNGKYVFSLSDVKAFDANPPSQGGSQNIQKASILTALQKLYENSPTARSILDQGVSESEIWLFQSSAEGSHAFSFTSIAAIDLSQATSLQFMGSDGRLQNETLEDNVIHELIHAILGWDDLLDPNTLLAYGKTEKRDYNDPRFNHIGATQGLANLIMQELADGGYPARVSQASYDAIVRPSNDSFLTPGISYSEDNFIDIAYFDSSFNKTQNVLDLSRRIDGSRDLIFGFSGNDVISGGAGNDYLYGGIGNDVISGGSGDDVIYGGDRRTAAASDDNDTALYAIGDLNSAPDHGVTVSIDRSVVSESDKMDGQTPIIVSDDGYGGRDRLFSIENIILSEYKDMVIVGKDSDDLFSSLKMIDAGINPAGELDTLDFSQLATGVTIVGGHWKITGTKFENFEKIVGTAKNDKIDFSGSKVNLEIRGGEGEDTIEGGVGNDYLDGGLGIDTASYDDAGTSQTIEMSGNGAPPDGVDASGPGSFLTVKRGAEVDVLHSIQKLTVAARQGCERLTGRDRSRQAEREAGHLENGRRVVQFQRA